MPWKTMDVQEQRVQFVVAAYRREKPIAVLCREFGISRSTGYVWLHRYRKSGIQGIVERSRRPHSSPQRTPAELEECIIEARRQYPDWGARKLQVVLSRTGLVLTRSAIHRTLLRHDLLYEHDRHVQAKQRFQRSRPNELWQMDFKGPGGWSGSVGPLSVLDDHSRYLVALQALGSPRTELVREQLESAFRRCGVPEGMLMDHGTPWWNTLAPSGTSRLALWLMRQGIRLHWSGFRHPQTQGKVERFHGELQRARLLRGIGGVAEEQAWLDAFRWEHNHVRPHEALEMRTPASVWGPSEHKYDPQPPRWEYPPGAHVVKVDSEGKLDAHGQRWKISKALSGEWVQLVPLEQRILVYYCTTLVRELDLATQRSTIVERWVASEPAG